MKKYSLVLEGGGAKGAYQIGAYKALKEAGYEFEAIIGTSIGALNAALIIQGDEEKLETLWRNISFTDIIDIDEEKVQGFIENKSINREIVSEIRKTAHNVVKSRGIKTEKIRKLFEKYIDENKIRNSDIRFGLVTFNVSDFKAEKLFIEDIPKGKLIDYLLATSNLPLFKRAKIDEKMFIDGGATDNCSVEMSYDAGYKDVIAVRLFLRNRIRNYKSLIKNKDLNLKMIVPSENLPYILNFETNTLNNMIDYGYIDAVKQLKKLDGTFYAINKTDKSEIEELLKKITPLQALEVVRGVNAKMKIGENILDILIKRAIPKISKNISEYKPSSLKNQMLDILEYVASKEKVNQNIIYDFKDFFTIVKDKVKNKELQTLKGIDKTVYYLISIL